MTTHEVDAAIAFATGEDVSFITNQGFSIVDLTLIDFDPEPNHLPASMVDWDSPFAGASICPFDVGD